MSGLASVSSIALFFQSINQLPNLQHFTQHWDISQPCFYMNGQHECCYQPFPSKLVTDFPLQYSVFSCFEKLQLLNLTFSLLSKSILRKINPTEEILKIKNSKTRQLDKNWIHYSAREIIIPYDRNRGGQQNKKAELSSNQCLIVTHLCSWIRMN